MELNVGDILEDDRYDVLITNIEDGWVHYDVLSVKINIARFEVGHKSEISMDRLRFALNKGSLSIRVTQDDLDKLWE